MKRRCVRCKERLKSDSTFCLACGHHSPIDDVVRRIQLEDKFKFRIDMLRLRNRITDIIRLRFWFWH